MAEALQTGKQFSEVGTAGSSFLRVPGGSTGPGGIPVAHVQTGAIAVHTDVPGTEAIRASNAEIVENTTL